MKVRAKQIGFYKDFRRRVGEEFTLTNPKHFSAKWMEKVTGAAPVAKTAAKSPETFSEMNKLTDEMDKKAREGKEAK